ncbi:hypothetical protein BGZ65_000837 [Modicella reniformis]|uniref:Lon N-terminal domain-containing protein n=1 Tax=Modicella reniformis TaxID=1440133 RepID=A0A9P6M097_9FUNG|nr:hypothetical protein BGZ65_000837 [Modicella reniformis]
MHYHNQPPNKALVRFLQYLATTLPNTTTAINDIWDVPREERAVAPTLAMTPLFITMLVFPKMPCFLMVFEPRYRKMLRNVLQTQSQLFGMVLPPQSNKGWDPDNTAWEPSMEYGTLLKIISCELLVDGRALVETVGVGRFQILTYSTMDGYFAATAVELIHDMPAEQELALERDALEAAARAAAAAQEDTQYAGAESSGSSIGKSRKRTDSDHRNGLQRKQTQDNQGRSRSAATAAAAAAVTPSSNSLRSRRRHSSFSSRDFSLDSPSSSSSTQLTSSNALSIRNNEEATQTEPCDLLEMNLEALSRKQLMEILMSFVIQMQERLGALAAQRLQREYGEIIDDDGQYFSFWVASIIPVSSYQKYELLRETSEMRERFGNEIMFLSFIVLILVTYFTGKRHNEVLAKTTMAVMLPLFRANFARVGDNGAELAIDAPHEYIIYLTGRRHVATVHGLIKMRPRQDLIRTIATFFSTPVPDTCTLNVTMNPNEYDDGVFAVVPKSTGTTIREKYYDLTTYTKASSQRMLDSSLITLTESNELTEVILPLISDKLNKAAQWLDYFIVSDQPSHKPENLPTEPHAKRISLSFRLPNANNAREIVPLVEALITCLDGLPDDCHITALTKTKIIKAREDASKEIGKKAQVERARELEEKRVREKREQEKNLSPDAQRKLAAKEEKRAIKKRQKSSTKRV